MNSSSPVVSIIVPTHNEADFIQRCLDSILVGCQGLSAEILVIDGMSTDQTRDILQKYVESHGIKLIDNKEIYQVYALNIGVTQSRGRFIIRCDAHSEYPPAYIKNLISYLEEDKCGLIGNVGSPYKTTTSAQSKLSKGVSLAMASKVGVGLSHRTSSTIASPLEVDTLLFGAWRRDIFERVGLFDTNYIRGQDYEHNLRIRECGLKVVMVPGEPFEYYTRPTFAKLRKMVFQYAYVKGQLIRKRKKLPNTRSLLPLAFFSFVLTSLICRQEIAWVALGTYSTVVVAAGLTKIRASGPVSALGMIAAVPQMHLFHAAGVLTGCLSNPRSQLLIKRTGHTR